MELRARPIYALLLLGAACLGPAAGSGTTDGIAEQVRGALGAAVALPGTQARVEIEVGQLDPRLRLAPCQRIETRLPPAAQMWGRTRVGLRCAEGERAWHVYLPVTVRVHAPALVPRRNLAPGTVITAEMLTTAEVDWAEQPSPPFARAADVVGRVVARNAAAGAPLRGTDLRQRQYFAAGDTVVLRARGPGFVVSGEGQALAAGIEGQSVRVRTESGRVLTGRPVGDGRVEVSL